jgi:hypothetical protein
MTAKPSSAKVSNRDRWMSQSWLSLTLACGCLLSPLLTVSLSAQQPPSAAVEKPATVEKPADAPGSQVGDETAKVEVSEERIAELVEKLGSDRFEERESASRELQKIGEPTLPALRNATQSKDREVRVRAEQLVRALDEKIRKSVTLKFLRETDPKLDFGMTGWRFASEFLGTGRKAKELFMEIYQANPKTIGLLETSREDGIVEVTNLAGRMSANIMAGSDPTIGETGLLLLAMYLPEIQANGPVHDAVKSATFSGDYKRSIMLDDKETPARKIFGHWISIVNDANASRAMLTARETRIPESAILARRMLNTELDDGDATVAISLILLFGDKQDVPLLEGMLKDEKELDRFELPIGIRPGGFQIPSNLPAPQSIPLDAPGRPALPLPRDNDDGDAPMPPKVEVFVAQKRDLALAALLHLAGQDLKQHFPLMTSSRRGITTSDVAFPESKPETRANAFEAWEKVRQKFLESKEAR